MFCIFRKTIQCHENRNNLQQGNSGELFGYSNGSFMRSIIVRQWLQRSERTIGFTQADLPKRAEASTHCLMSRFAHYPEADSSCNRITFRPPTSSRHIDMHLTSARSASWRIPNRRRSSLGVSGQRSHSSILENQLFKMIQITRINLVQQQFTYVDICQNNNPITPYVYTEP